MKKKKEEIASKESQDKSASKEDANTVLNNW
jgi:hypothetical protein